MPKGLQANLHLQEESSFGHPSNLYDVRASNIHGNGLFAKSNLKKNTILTYYDGEMIDWKEAKARADKSYIKSLSHGHCAIDGLRVPIIGKGAGSFVNHSNCPNAFYHVIHDIIWIKLKKHVECGEEIFVSYGNSYWKRQYIDTC